MNTSENTWNNAEKDKEMLTIIKMRSLWETDHGDPRYEEHHS